MNNIIDFFITYKDSFVVAFLIVGICLGIHAMHFEIFDDMWQSASFFGKVISCIYATVSLPGIIVYILGLCIISLFVLLHDLAFPRKSGYTLKVAYDKKLYEALKENKIYCEHWGQINLETSVLVFLWKRDYEKALKLFPDLQDRIVEL